MKIEINTFAVLKEHFPSSFELEVNNIYTIAELKNELCKISPSASAMLNSSRFAVNEIFVNDSTIVSEYASVFIVPPSSGG